MDDRQLQNAIMASLETNLTDPREQYTSSGRDWVHTDKPLASATFPRIQLSKRGPTVSRIMSIGFEFWEQRVVTLDIQFWSAPGFKWKNSSNVYLTNEELVKHYLEVIGTTLKAQQSTLYSTYGITGFNILSEDDPYQEPDTKLYTGIISVRFWYFRQ